MKETAVEFLVKTLELDTRFNGIMNDVIEQAKQMEKEQIIYAYLKDRRGEFDVVLKLIDDAEQYYNETYEQDKQG